MDNIVIEKDGRRYHCQGKLLLDLVKEIEIYERGDELDQAMSNVFPANENRTVFAVVEMEQECNKEKNLSDTHVFDTREQAMAFLHARYLDVRLKIDAGAGEFSADYAEEGWYVCVDKDGDCWEGYVSERLVIGDTGNTIVD